MLIWINGAYGSGKTTLAETLATRLPDALTFDPELVGSLVRESTPDEVPDFQDIPLWRKLSAQVATALWQEYRRPLIIPMTVTTRTYRDEIFGAIAAAVPLLHVYLDVPADELRRRIESQILPNDPGAREFRLATISRCVAAAHLPPATLILPADQLTPDQLADRVLAALPGQRRAQPETNLDTTVALILEWLGERGVNALLRIDAERLSERRPAWTFAASGGPLNTPMRADGPTIDACLTQAAARLREQGLAVPW